MGQRGPRPTPTPILKLRGSRELESRRDEPIPDVGRPIRPSWVKGRARKVWEEITPKLARMGVLTKIDRLALARYCDTWAMWHECREFIAKHGSMYPIKGKDGKPKYFGQYPVVAQLHKHAEVLRRLEVEFGLTPAARTRIKVEAPKDADRDPFADLGMAG